MLKIVIISLTILYTVLISELIILIKDINKRIKNTNFLPDTLKKIKMGKMACIFCIIILLIILFTNYLSFFKII